MKEYVAKAIVEAVSEFTDTKITLYENYSGRGMYGKTTHAVVVKDWGVWSRAVAEAAARFATESGTTDYTEFTHEVGRIRWDDFARDIIVY